MSYFSLDAFTKNTSSTGLSATIFGILTESGDYTYTASGTPVSEAYLFRDTGSALITYEGIVSPKPLQLSIGSGSNDFEFSGSIASASVDVHIFKSEYPNPYVFSETELEGPLASQSLQVKSFKEGTIPFQSN